MFLLLNETAVLLRITRWSPQDWKSMNATTMSLSLTNTVMGGSHKNLCWFFSPKWMMHDRELRRYSFWGPNFLSGPGECEGFGGLNMTAQTLAGYELCVYVWVCVYVCVCLCVCVCVCLACTGGITVDLQGPVTMRRPAPTPGTQTQSLSQYYSANSY
jgi:hypothetical protein